MTACPTPDKRAYRSKAKANKFQRRTRPPLGEKKDRLWPYQCVCGAWHLTHQSPATQARVRARIDANTAALARARAEQQEREAS